jgi:hypothetical protein
MNHIRSISIIIIFAVVFVWAFPLKGEDYIEDLIDIQELDGDVIAIREGREKLFDLPSAEKILWSGSKGYIGAVLTERRFLAISESSISWHEISLKEKETQEAITLLSEYLALLVTVDRGICFDGKNNRFIELQRPANEEFLELAVNKYVAVVVSSRYAFGLALGGEEFNKIPFRPNEYFETLKTTAHFATIRTTKRVLTFMDSDSSWTVVDRPLR